MAITYTWKVSQMDAYPLYDGQTDVVFTVHWNLTGMEDSYRGYVYGTVGLTLNTGETFTPYDELTESQVINWVKQALGEELVASYEASVAEQIDIQINPPIVSPPLPWL